MDNYCPIIPRFIEVWLQDTKWFLDDATKEAFQDLTARFVSTPFDDKKIPERLRHIGEASLLLFEARAEKSGTLFRKQFEMKLDMANVVYELYKPRSFSDKHGDFIRRAKDAIDTARVKNLEAEIDGSLRVDTGSLRFGHRERLIKSGEAVLELLEHIEAVMGDVPWPSRNNYVYVSGSLAVFMREAGVSPQDVIRFANNIYGGRKY